MNILYFVVGNSTIIHQQVAFSLRTMAAQLGTDDHIYVLTDTPMLYQTPPRNGVTIKSIPISEELLTEWRGKHNFFWRIKLKAIELITSLSPNNHLIYLDGDTCLKGDLNEIRQLLDSGVPLMHKDEGPLSAMNGKSLAMWNQIKSRSYGGVSIEERLHEWNAGVVAIPANMLSKVASQALTICDEMLAESVEPIVIEQYSLAQSIPFV